VGDLRKLPGFRCVAEGLSTDRPGFPGFFVGIGMWQDFLAALALVFVIEGMLPFLSPGGYRDAVRRLAELGDRQLRAFGLGAMAFGVLLLYLVRS
jgi:hypothetical protein